ncbi:MAG: hypothetical protein HW380_430 [Magnetococcales bacterium]|nr:hypothetical protein [Magnetococcales bacterium]HIJ83680.1 hypothetical protein [Magnetococcales bacterium]
MSKLAPRNATVRIVDADCDPYVIKRYHATFTAVAEHHAYTRMQPLCAAIPGVRTAKIIQVDAVMDTLRLEFIPGTSLYESVCQGHIRLLHIWRDSLLQLFFAAKNNNIYFDADPSNFIIHENGRELVVIDPVCKPVDLEDYALVVFLWGLFKIMLRSVRVWHIGEIFGVIMDYSLHYRKITGSRSDALRMQMGQYIHQVIAWNRESSPVDGPLTTALRRGVVIPTFTLIQWLLKKGWVKI